VQLFAVPAQSTADLAASMSSGLSDAATNVGNVPVVGGALRDPLDAMSDGFVSIQTYALSTVHMIYTAALVLAIIVFVVPVVVWLWKWLPWRVKFVAQSVRAARLLRTSDAVELFALRAMATAPMGALVSVTANPMDAWKTGDLPQLRRLAAMELGRYGLALPRGQQPRSVPWS